MFNQDDPEDPESGNDIVYDDGAINQLLDRSQEGIEEKVTFTLTPQTKVQIDLQILVEKVPLTLTLPPPTKVQIDLQILVSSVVICILHFTRLLHHSVVQVQLGSEYRTSPIFKWLKVVCYLNGVLVTKLVTEPPFNFYSE